jgi:hypothetical protein
VARGNQQAKQQSKPRKRGAGDEGNDPRGRVAFAEVGENIQAGDDAKEDDR